jgi:hypothetical protein
MVEMPMSGTNRALSDAYRGFFGQCSPEAVGGEGI